MLNIRLFRRQKHRLHYFDLLWMTFDPGVVVRLNCFTRNRCTTFNLLYNLLSQVKLPLIETSDNRTSFTSKISELTENENR